MNIYNKRNFSLFKIYHSNNKEKCINNNNFRRIFYLDIFYQKLKKLNKKKRKDN